MHIVKVNGGLGNQMFQYVFALTLDAKYADARLDLEWIKKYRAHNGYELDRLFSVRLPECDAEERRRLGETSDNLLGKVRRRLRLTKSSYYAPPSYGYDQAALERHGDTYFAGYWQSYKYCTGREDLVRSAFEFCPQLSRRNREILDRAAGRTLIGIHVRRGDSLKNPMVIDVCDEAYYLHAVEAVISGASAPLVLYFSDDLQWCRDKLPAPGETLYVDWNAADESYQDMMLMKACDALVISNSTFSWWGAWLGGPGRKIIAPSRWFSRAYADNEDIVPPEWVRL